MTRNNPPIKLLDAWGGWTEISSPGGGIFDALGEEYTVPWSDQTLISSNKSLDYDYFGNRSGNKKCSPLLYSLMGTDTELDSTSKANLIQLIHDKFFLNWEALWNSYKAGIMAGYNPFNNYNITETGEHEQGKSGTFSSSDEKGETDNFSKYGFNSSEASPIDEHSSSATDGYSNEHSNSEEGSYSKQFSGTKDVIKADIIKKEREIWVVNYFDTVFKDVDSVLTSMIYNRTHEPAPYFWFPFGYNHI